VLSSDEELYQAYDDYSTGKNGFEGSKTWKSEIRHLKKKKDSL